MDESQMLEVVEASADARVALSARMAPLYQGRPAAWLQEGERMKRYTISEVRVDGVAVGVFWWWFSPGNKTLVANAGASLSSQDILCPLLAGIEEQARKVGATRVQFQTARRGLVEKSKVLGWTPEGIVMSKPL